MKANELRVGNWFNEFGIPKQVTPNLILKLYQIEIAGKVAIDISPIPLTPEILVKAGFRQSISNEKVYVLKIGENNLMLKNDVAWFYWAGLSYPFKYLHQLQNLVFAIHGEELAIQL
jgi:hypothetical protein